MACEDERAWLEYAQGERAIAEADCVAAETEAEMSQCRAKVMIADGMIRAAQEALRRCEEAAANPAPNLMTTSGYIKMLIVQRAIRGYGGGQTNRIDTEIVFTLFEDPSRGFGIYLREDSDLSASEGMLGLLRDAYAHNWRVYFDYLQPAEEPNQNSIVIRVWLQKEATLPPWAVGLGTNIVPIT